MKTQLVIPAAGSGERLGEQVPKALVPLGADPLLVFTLKRFEALGLKAAPVVAIPAELRDAFEQAVQDCASPPRLVTGGATRQDSVANALQALDADTDVVIIHDAARPFVPMEAVRASIDAALEVGAATVALPAIDTILLADKAGYLASTPDRGLVWACQTPQTFRVEVIRAAHKQALAEQFAGTDDASLVRRLGHPVRLVRGSSWNLKVTTPQDLALARLLLREGLV